MGEIANVLKNAVDAASIKGSFFFSSLNDFHNNLKNHFNELSIASVSTGRHKNLLPVKKRLAFQYLPGVIFRVDF